MKIKNKKLPVILGALGVVAVTSIGFATWVVGYQHTVEENTITVTVDGHKDKSIILEYVTSDTTITLAETTTPAAGSSVTAETTTGDFTITASSFKLNVTDDFLTENTINSIDFSVTGLPKTTVGAGDKFGRTAKEYDYITLAKTTIPFDTVNKNVDSTTLTGWKIYDLSSAGPITFKWGDMFDLSDTIDKADSPAEFYNSKIGKYNPDESITSTANKKVLDQWTEAGNELEAMKTAFQDKTINVKITANFSKKI